MQVLAAYTELAADAAATAQTSQFVMAMITTRTGPEAVQVGAGLRFAERSHLARKNGLACSRSTEPAMALVGDHPGAASLKPACRAGQSHPTAPASWGRWAELIALRGLQPTSTRDIAAAVGVEHGRLQTLRPNAISQ